MTQTIVRIWILYENFISLQPGTCPFSTLKNRRYSMGRILLAGFLAAIVAASLLGKLSWSLASKYGSRVRYVMTLGIFLALAARITDWGFFGYSASFTLVLAINDVIGWTLAGLVIAWRMKPLM